MQRLDPQEERQFMESLRFASDFFMGESNVHQAVVRICDALRAAEIPYAVHYGHQRATENVDLLLTSDGLVRFKQLHMGRGWVEKFPGSRGLRDAVARVDIDVVLSGEYPGDGKPKPVAFPDPEKVALPGERVALLPLEVLVELKLASGISAPHRLRDLADVLELVRIRGLDEDFAESLDPSVRAKYLELVAASKSGLGDE